MPKAKAKKKQVQIDLNDEYVLVPGMGVIHRDIIGYNDGQINKWNPVIPWSSCKRFFAAILEFNSLKAGRHTTSVSFWMNLGEDYQVYCLVGEYIECGCQSFEWDDIVRIAKKT